MDGIRFEWDPAKAIRNRRKHGVSFEEAQTAFLDDRALIIDEGKVLKEGTRRDIITDPLVRKAYLGNTFRGNEFD